MRADKSGLICGIGGYPATECGVEIDMPTATTEPQTMATITDEEAGASDNSKILPVALAIGLAISIFVIIRKRKK